MFSTLIELQASITQSKMTSRSVSVRSSGAPHAPRVSRTSTSVEGWSPWLVYPEGGVIDAVFESVPVVVALTVQVAQDSALLAR